MSPYKNPEDATTQRRRWQEENREKVNFANRESYHKHREERIAKQVTYQKENIAIRRKYQRHWNNANYWTRREYAWREKKMRYKGGPMTRTVFLALFELQEGKCAICGIKFAEKRIHVEHDHKTDEVRGLVCWRCNQFIIGSNSVDSTRVLLEYLTNSPASRLDKVAETPLRDRRLHLSA